MKMKIRKVVLYIQSKRSFFCKCWKSSSSLSDSVRSSKICFVCLLCLWCQNIHKLIYLGNKRLNSMQLHWQLGIAICYILTRILLMWLLWV